MKFIGHLDLMRCFQKVIRRSGLDIAYSGGYSPHQIMSFAQPLGVGCESEGEYMDLEMRSVTNSRNIIQKLNVEMPEGLMISDVVILPSDAPNAMSSVERASYLLMTPALHRDEIEKRVHSFREADRFLIEKKTKKGSREVDLKSEVHEISILAQDYMDSQVDRSGADSSLDLGGRNGSAWNFCGWKAMPDTALISVTLTAGSGTNIKPELFLRSVFQESFGGDRAFICGADFYVCRMELFDRDGSPLIGAGKDF